MKFHHYARASFAAISLLPGCIATSDADDVASAKIESTPESQDTTSTALTIPGTASATLGGIKFDAKLVSAFNPCSPYWQLPTGLSYDVHDRGINFHSFERVLRAKNARFVGNASLGTPYRAIVQVDTYNVTDPKANPTSGLWYLAAIPVASPADIYDVKSLVKKFEDRTPVNSRVLGYCTNSGKFVVDIGDVTPDIKIFKQVVVEYDPRCVCGEISMAFFQHWEDPAAHEITIGSVGSE